MKEVSEDGPEMGLLEREGIAVGCYSYGHMCLSWFCQNAWRKFGMQVPPHEVRKSYWGGTKITYWERKTP